MYYVIGVKRVRDYHNKPLKEEEQYFEYVMHDKYNKDSPILTAASGFDDNSCHFIYWLPFIGKPSLEHAEIFNTVQEAKDFWKQNRKHLTTTDGFSKDYDISTLSIKEITFETVCKLK